MPRISDAKPRLMDAARTLIWENSYGSTSVDAICLKAGVRKGSFYHFFESKSALATEASRPIGRRNAPVWMRCSPRRSLPSTASAITLIT